MSCVAIIGGGITGLTAAYRLRSLGTEVTVFEAARRTGGVVRSIRRDGFLAESGPNTLMETSPVIAELVTQLGLNNRRLDTNPAAEKRFIARGGRPVPVPGSPLGFFTSGLFSLKAKLRLLLEPCIAKGHGEESVAEFVERRLGIEMLNYAIEPLVGGIYAGRPSNLSIQHAFRKVYDLEQRYGSLILGQFLGARERKHRKEVSKDKAKKLSFDQGLQVLPDTLAEKLGDAIRTNTRVTAVRQVQGEKWEVEFACDGVRETMWFDAVLFAAPLYTFPSLRIQPAPTVASSLFKRVDYPPVASVALGFKRHQVDHPLDGFGVLVPAVEPFKILGTLFTSSFLPGRAPAGSVILTTYIGGGRNPALALAPREELLANVRRDLEALLGVHGDPIFEEINVFPKAIPQYHVGYGEVKTALTTIEKELPGFFFAGHYRDGISLSDSIVSGWNAAPRIIEALGSAETSAQPISAFHE